MFNASATVYPTCKCPICQSRCQAVVSRDPDAVGQAQDTVLRHIMLEHPSLVEQLPVVSLGQLVQLGASSAASDVDGLR
jgi:hypothetical protein